MPSCICEVLPRKLHRQIGIRREKEPVTVFSEFQSAPTELRHVARLFLSLFSVFLSHYLRLSLSLSGHGSLMVPTDFDIRGRLTVDILPLFIVRPIPFARLSEKKKGGGRRAGRREGWHGVIHTFPVHLHISDS